MLTVTVENHCITAEQAREAAAALERDGLVALAGATVLEEVDALGKRMLADLDAFDRSERGPLQNNWQGLRPPPAHPHLHESIVFNEAATAVLRLALGERPIITEYGANTAFVGEPEEPHGQHVHIDHGSPQPPGPCIAVAVNIPLVDVTELNGPTMWWP